MRKYIFLIVLIMTVFSLSGCSIKQAGRFMGQVERSGCASFGCN
jgi:hypothetical protein